MQPLLFIFFVNFLLITPEPGLSSCQFLRELYAVNELFVATLVESPVDLEDTPKALMDRPRQKLHIFGGTELLCEG